MSTGARPSPPLRAPGSGPPRGDRAPAPRLLLGAAPSLLLSLAIGACDESSPGADLTGITDGAAGEVLVFPDSRPGRDSDAALTDGPLPGDGPRERSLLDGTGPGPDLPWPDHAAPPDLPPAACSLFGQFSCSKPSWVYQCVAMCTATSSYTIYCMATTAVCYCVKNGTTQGNCAVSGSACTACQNAFSCCKGYF